MKISNLICVITVSMAFINAASSVFFFPDISGKQYFLEVIKSGDFFLGGEYLCNALQRINQAPKDLEQSCGAIKTEVESARCRFCTQFTNYLKSNLIHTLQFFFNPVVDYIRKEVIENNYSAESILEAIQSTGINANTFLVYAVLGSDRANRMNAGADFLCSPLLNHNVFNGSYFSQFWPWYYDADNKGKCEFEGQDEAILRCKFCTAYEKANGKPTSNSELASSIQNTDTNLDEVMKQMLQLLLADKSVNIQESLANIMWRGPK